MDKESKEEMEFRQKQEDLAQETCRSCRTFQNLSNAQSYFFRLGTEYNLQGYEDEAELCWKALGHIRKLAEMEKDRQCKLQLMCKIFL